MTARKKSSKGKREKRENFLVDNYRKCWDYIKSSGKFIWIIVGIFFTFALIGFFVPVSNSFHDLLVKYIKEIAGQIAGLSPANLIAFIFFNNAKSSLFGWVFGILLGIFPIFVSVFNGYLLGFVSRLSVNQDGVLVLWKLLPHGVFELPAVFISLGMGMKLGVALLKDKEAVKENFMNALRVFVSIVIPLLIIAAIIEGTLISVLG